MKSLRAVTAKNPTNKIFPILINAATVAIHVLTKMSKPHSRENV